MNIDNLIHEAADEIRKLEFFASTPVFEEDLGDIEQNIESGIAQTARCAMVGWNGCELAATERGRDANGLLVNVNLVVSLFESPVVNRADDSAPRLLQMAQLVAKTLDDLGTEDMDEGLHFSNISKIVEIRPGVISCDVTFKTKNSL